MRPSACAGCLLILAQAGFTNAAFSFGGKRFKNEGLLNAGSLGLADGKVAAWGDADNDQLCVYHHVCWSQHANFILLQYGCFCDQRRCDASISKAMGSQ